MRGPVNKAGRGILRIKLEFVLFDTFSELFVYMSDVPYLTPPQGTYSHGVPALNALILSAI